MALDRQAIDRLRTALEKTHSSAATSSLLFEALAGWRGPVPATSEELLKLIHGPLAETLIRRAGAAEARRLLGQILETVQDAPKVTTGSAASDSAVGGERQPDDDPDRTQAVPIARDPVEVVVVGASEHFAQRLLAVLGPKRIRSRAVTDPARLKNLEPIPALVVIDSQDFPATEPTAIVSAMTGLPATTSALLWGAHLPYGRMVAKSFKEQGRPLVPLTQEHGIAPLLDLIRSRRRG